MRTKQLFFIRLIRFLILMYYPLQDVHCWKINNKKFSKEGAKKKIEQDASLLEKAVSSDFHIGQKDDIIEEQQKLLEETKDGNRAEDVADDDNNDDDDDDDNDDDDDKAKKAQKTKDLAIPSKQYHTYMEELSTILDIMDVLFTLVSICFPPAGVIKTSMTIIMHILPNVLKLFNVDLESGKETWKVIVQFMLNCFSLSLKRTLKCLMMMGLSSQIDKVYVWLRENIFNSAFYKLIKFCIPQKLITFFNNVWKFLKEAWNFIKKNAEEFVNSVNNVINNIPETIENSVKTISKEVRKHVNNAMNGISRASEIINKNFKPMHDEIKKGVNNVANFLAHPQIKINLNHIHEGIKKGVNDVANFIAHPQIEINLNPNEVKKHAKNVVNFVGSLFG